MHPSYLNMISTAILSTKHNGKGIKKSVISEYIQRNYDGLSSGSRFDYYLTKALQRGIDSNIFKIADKRCKRNNVRYKLVDAKIKKQIKTNCIKIEVATYKDKKIINKILNEIKKETGYIVRLPSNEFDVLLEDNDYKGWHFKAIYLGKCVGLILSMPYDDTTVWICQFAVLSKYRGNGIGTKLINKIFTKCVSMDKISQCKLNVCKKNNSAIKYYKKQGFKITHDDLEEASEEMHVMTKCFTKI